MIASLLLQCIPPKEPYFIMHSNREHKQSNSEEIGEYRKFDAISIQMREPLIQTGAKKVIAHATSNGGKCRWGYVKGLLEDFNKQEPLLAITRDDINNKVRNINGQHQCEEEGWWEDSPAIPIHVIHNPSLCTDSDLSVSAGPSEQNPLDVLAVKPLERLKMQIKHRYSPIPIDAPTKDVAHHFIL
jgi:hypothetical protein